MNLLESVRKDIVAGRERANVDVRPGDTVRLHLKIVEGD